MRIFSLMAGCVAITCAAFSAKGTTITFADLRKDAQLGIQVHATGPTDIPFVPGLLEVYGSTDAFLANSVTSRYYSGYANFDRPVKEITFDVSRLNNSGWDSNITVVGLDDRRRVAAAIVNLAPLGEVTHVTLSAPDMTQVRWTGADWIFHPYVIRDVSVSFADVGTTPTAGSTTPSVSGAPVPEPGSCAIFSVVGAATLLRRRR